MRSETEIRKQVETRFRRWGLLVLNGILWLGVAKLIFIYNQTHSLSASESDIIALVMIAWVILVGLHVMRVTYVELRELLVHRAIARERRNYEQSEAYEKPKRLELSDDGELVDFPAQPDSKSQIKRE